MDIVYVIHQFEAENEDEITLRIGDPVIVLERDDGFEDGWWKGRNVDGQQGLFPVNYTSADPPLSDTADHDEAEYEMTEDDVSTSSHSLSTPSVATTNTNTTITTTNTHRQHRQHRQHHQHQSLYSMRTDDSDEDDDNGDRISSRSSSVMMFNPPILSPNITFVSKNLQKAVRATLLSTTLSHIPPEQWEAEQVADWLKQLGFDTVVDQFIELEISTFGKRFKIHSAILALREEIFRQDPFYLHPSKSCLSTTEDYHWMLTGQGHPPQKYSLHRSSLEEITPHSYTSIGRKSSIADQPYQYHYISPPQSPMSVQPHSSIRPSNYTSSSSHRRKLSVESQEDHVTPDMEGWLYKQGDKYKTWNKRWFVLKGSNLFYFKSPKDVRMKGIINLRGYRMVCDEMICVGQYSFKAQHESERTFFFYAESDVSMRAWIQSLIKATIARDFNAPVVSSSTIPTVSLDIARRMNPRPPSTILYLNQASAKSSSSTRDSSDPPSPTLSSPPLMISSFSDSNTDTLSNTSIHDSYLSGDQEVPN
ncbi:hypothetical protein BC941DRAFT_466985 [Chlamydoabsidia padenii]|nr:hypothetical protein BC941DRAFT_466985 [Chlamydoabsidia padenii]